MTRTLTLRSLDIPSVHKFGIGFDTLFDELLRNSQQGQNNYPPYNVVKLTDDNFYIEVATAGFSEGEIDIQLDNRLLTIKGSKKREDAIPEYLHQGISNRDFVREFTLAEHVEVSNALIKDGILTVFLERKIPEERKPKTIAITYTT
jgi:molecular chaperone IbpA